MKSKFLVNQNAGNRSLTQKKMRFFFYIKINFLYNFELGVF
ncbi:hypothetical protein BMY_0798 [Wohlfahrtiimonas chitiniclastica]|nr:hypothetical protein BMY_0798 [Wohlfahrtiimonas chitiniclastica]